VSEAQSVGCPTSAKFPEPMEVEAVKVITSQVILPKLPVSTTSLSVATKLHPSHGSRLGASTEAAPCPPTTSLPSRDVHYSPLPQAADPSSFGSNRVSTPPGTKVESTPSAPPPPRPPPVPPLPVATLELLQDRLGKLVLASATALGSCSFHDLCVCHRGPSWLTGQSTAPHPAVPILQQLRDEGACVSHSAPDWTLAKRDAAIIRGAHRSTQSNSTLVREEFADMVEAGQWLVLPYALVRHLPGLCLSPTGLVPQRDRRDRLIVDYTFSGVNPYTIPTAPDSLQFGHAFLRILQYLHRADTRRGPIYLAKVDIADAFMRVWLCVHHIPI
jgi:hypothetical protein